MNLKTLRYVVALLVVCAGLTGTALAASKNHISIFDGEDFLSYRHFEASSYYSYTPGGIASEFSSFGSSYFYRVTPPAAKPLPAAPTSSLPINDPYFLSSGSWKQPYQDLWGDYKIGLSGDLLSRYDGAGVRIAVVDSGVNYTKADIASNIWRNTAEISGNWRDDDRNGFVDDTRGWDFVDRDNSPMDLNGHGTHVAGIIAAAAGNGTGIVGVAPKATIIPVRVLDANGSGSILNVAKGIVYAVNAGAKIINLSLGAPSLNFFNFYLLQNAVNYAVNLGRFVVAAAGNSNSDVNYFSPANLSGVIAVGATDPYDRRASFSNYGSKLFMTAPGVDILSLGSSNASIGIKVADDYYRASGTSMAAPFVSGAIALLLNKYPDASLKDMQALLALGAADLGSPGWDPYYGYGRLDVAKSLSVSLSSAASSGKSGTTTTAPVSSAAQSSAMSKSFVEELMDATEETISNFFTDPKDGDTVTAGDIERATASLHMVGTNTYQEQSQKYDTLLNFRD